jgi:CDP-glucose 4,6-dehydratase
VVLGRGAVEDLAGLSTVRRPPKDAKVHDARPAQGRVCDGQVRGGQDRYPDAAPFRNTQFWRGKRVLLTGHTGFKGGWAALWLHRLGAEVTGLGLAPDQPGLCSVAGVEQAVRSHRVDLRDAAGVAKVVADSQPQLVLHMAAQPLVRRSLREPIEAFATNVLGTVHLLQALREVEALEAVLVVTTDKVYAPDADGQPHREDDRLGGCDPYAASKAACELATAAMATSFLRPAGVAVATARGGNVIGGGDFAADRLVPDAMRAALSGNPLVLRNPAATRPWQHVMDCLSGYMMFLAALAQHRPLPASLNFGPAAGSPQISVGSLASTMLEAFGAATDWTHDRSPQPPETHALALDSCQARQVLGWHDRLSGQPMIDATAAWYRAWAEGEEDMRAVTLRQIAAYEAMP